MYYLQSRYYDANLGRFVNADESVYAAIGVKVVEQNLFTYCENNSINMVDFNGRKPGTLFKSMDAAALDFAKEYNVISIKKKSEYTSIILKITRWELKSYGFSKYLKKYVLCTYYKYTTPKRWFGKSGFFWPWEAKRSVALLHTHGAMRKNDANTFSRTDRATANKYYKIMYVSTPFGKLLKYDPDDYSIHTISTKIPIV